MDTKRHMLHHLLAGIAYRMQKALRGAPADFAHFAAGSRVRTPHDIVQHMDSVLGYARTFFHGGTYQPPRLPFEEQIALFHQKLDELAADLDGGTPLRGITEEQLLQGPFADVMTHAGQLAMLRRLAGSPIPPENFIFADVDRNNLGPQQAEPAAPDAEWPEAAV
ncbi:MAG: hypothetical protein ACYSX0_13355 [Planctomycetota bacterium]|jgi:hypothetical protein